MMEALKTIGFFALVCGFSMAVTYMVSSWRGRKREEVSLPEGAKVRMVGPGGAYRSFYLRTEKCGLVFSAPLHKNCYVPLRPGDTVIVQCPYEGGIVTFSSKISERRAEPHELVVAKPEALRQVDRRSEPRDATCRGSEAGLNGDKAAMVDLSAGGAKLLATQRVEPGETVRVDLPMGLGEAYGWALESAPAGYGDEWEWEVRVQFQRPLSGLRTLRKGRAQLR